MVDIKNKQDCVGCNACVQVCPKACIDMRADEQGFSYPCVDLSRCIDCHLCERVCPVIHQKPERKPLASFAVRNIRDEIVGKSSSGGVFFALAEAVIREGGVVFGARFDENWNVVHDYADDIAGIESFQGSKYAQSEIGNSFREAERFLKEGRKVMFTGTPCQLAALQLYLRHDYGDRLLKTDVVCHGVPSPLSWSGYLNYFSAACKANHISKISFRDKCRGWDRYGLAFTFEDKQSQECEIYSSSENNLFMEAFLRNFNLRPSCYDCPVKSGKSQSDITLGDFWGVETTNPDLYDSRGISAVMAFSGIGLEAINKNRSILCRNVEYADILSHNLSLEQSVSKPEKYDIFWQEYVLGGWRSCRKFLATLRPSVLKRILHRLKLCK